MNGSIGGDCEHVLHEFIADVHATAPTNLPTLINRHAVRLGWGMSTSTWWTCSNGS